VRVTLTNGASPPVKVTGTATVMEAPLFVDRTFVRATAGRAFTAVVASFTDKNPLGRAGDYQAVIDWGDGQTSIGTIAFDGQGRGTVLGTHTYAVQGNYAVVVKVRDDGGNTVTAVSRVAVAAVSLKALGKQLVAVQGQPFTEVVATFTDTDLRATASLYTAQITWGDGRTSVGVIATDNKGGFTIRGKHTFTATGSFPLVVTIRDAGGNQATAKSTVKVNSVLKKS
jgi:hypothetical protein